jgi:NodT family efflux transporter outer membrane factor (OMF) lipoprotein
MVIQHLASSGRVVALGILMAAGCQTASRYERPETDLPEAWLDAEGMQQLDDGGTLLQAWWDQFGDADLSLLIERALSDSLILQTAALRIEEAMALRGVAAGDRVPSVDGSGAMQTARLSDAEGGTLRDSRSVDIYRVGLDASWELDLWGRIRHSVRVADAAVGAAMEDYRDALVILAGEVARQYFVVRELQERIVLLNENIKAQESTLRMTQGRYDNGLAPALDVHQAELNLARSQAGLAPLRSQLNLALNRLAVLTGQPPGTIVLPAPDEWQETIPDFGLTAGIPADLLTRRPDLRRAEQQLMAQTARLGVARTDLLPRISLSGTFALQAEGVGDLGSSGSLSYRFGPTFFWPLFHGGRIRSNIDAVESRVEQAVLQYRQAVLTALEEVENAWVAYQLERDRYDLLQRSVAAAERSVQQVLTLYDNGLVPFLNVLDAERSLVQQHDQLAQSRGQIYRGLVQVHRALGSGWELKPTGE